MRRGAALTAIAGKAKTDRVRSLGVDRVIARGDDIVAGLGEKSVDVVVDNVGGPAFPQMLKVLKRGGKFVLIPPPLDGSQAAFSATAIMKPDV